MTDLGVENTTNNANEDEVRKGMRIIFNITEAIKKIVEEDKKQKQPLFLKVKDSFIFRLVKSAISEKDKRLLIGIAGESASGKTTFVQSAIKNYPSAINGGVYTVINCDDYYFDTSEELKKAGNYENLFATGFSFDTPDAINLDLMVKHLKSLKNGEEIQSPAYNFVTCESNLQGERKAPAKIILNEGLYVLKDDIKDIMDVKVYVFTPFNVIKDRWFSRAESRGKTGVAAEKQFADVNQTAQIHIRPAMEIADVILNGLVPHEYITNVINDIFTAIKEAIKKSC